MCIGSSVFKAIKYQEVDKTSGDFKPTNAADRLAHTDNEYVNPSTGTSVPDWKRDRGDTKNEWRERKRLEYDQRRADWWARLNQGPHGFYDHDTAYPDYIAGDG
tara:strand:+ start:193 stop:504 length:312 start_codon:yes stop_codon:yes gene_type:complete